MSKRLPKLSSQDAAIVDLVLDHAANKTGVKRLSPAQPLRRLSAVTKVLSLLDRMTDETPPADLVTQTLRRIEKFQDRQVGHRAVIHGPAGVHPRLH